VVAGLLAAHGKHRPTSSGKLSALSRTPIRCLQPPDEISGLVICPPVSDQLRDYRPARP
jgi:hypothetical protein